jgi:hypothetical protein
MFCIAMLPPFVPEIKDYGAEHPDVSHEQRVIIDKPFDDIIE